MLLLVTDTSGKHGSVALVHADGQDKLELIESSPLAGGTFSAQLVPQIATLLSQHGLSKRDIGAFIVISGPGSFTGLRVGLAAIKALAEILQKPIVPVSLLEVLAVASGERGRFVTMLDAGRAEVYVGEYEVTDSARVCREELLKIEGFTPSLGKAATITPDESVATVLKQQDPAVQIVKRPGAEAIALVGIQKLQAGATVTPEQLEANYIRRSDAEIFAKPVPGC